MAIELERYWKPQLLLSTMRSAWRATWKMPNTDHPDLTHRILLNESGETFTCHAGEAALVAMAKSGRRGIPLGCRGGGCGVCKVEVIEGQYSKKIMSRSHISLEDEKANRVLACCIFPESDLRIHVIGRMQRSIDRCKADSESS